MSESIKLDLKAKIKTGIVLGGFALLIFLMTLGSQFGKKPPQAQKPGATSQSQRYTAPKPAPTAGKVAAGAEKSAGFWASAKTKIAGWLDFSEEKKPAAAPAPAPAAARSAVAVRPAAVAPPPAAAPAAAEAPALAAAPAAVAPAPAVAAAPAPAPTATPAPAAAPAPVARPVAAAKPKPAPAESTPELDRLMHGLDGILKN